VPPDDPFDELTAGVPDDRSSEKLGASLETLASAASEDELFDQLASQRPPSSKLVRQLLRGRLKKLLQKKLEQFNSGASPARTADAWLQEGSETSNLQGREFVA
jgi:hypothetical protein